MQQKLAVTAGSNSDPDVEVDRGRHHEAVIIVGVLSNEVYATRSSIHTRPVTVTLAEFLLQQLGCYLRLGSSSISSYSRYRPPEKKLEEKLRHVGRGSRCTGIGRNSEPLEN